MERVNSLIKFVIFIATFYLAAALTVFALQRRLIYRPDQEPRQEPAQLGLSGVVEKHIAAPDGGGALAWYGKARAGQPTLLYFHGNAGSLASRSERIRKYMAKGRGVFMMTYRGYSGSAGTPSEEANTGDGKRAYEALRAEGVDAKDIIIYGESLGTGVAVQVAAEKGVGGLILDAPFDSFSEVAAWHYPWLPARSLVLDRYDSRSFIGAVKAPALFVHGERDDVVPLAMGQALFARASDPKRMITFPEAGHADHYIFGSYEAINAWIDDLRQGKLEPAAVRKVTP